jgi:2-polyprenyl-3-methyl-5-hydroxy-6-metoxy-1,4-benzoquinol methylase
MYSDLMDGIFFSAPGRWIMYRCRGCGSGYLDPRPTATTIGLAYQSYFTHRVDEREAVVIDKLSWPRRLRHALANGYRNYRFGLNLQPANRLGILVGAFRPRWRALEAGKVRHLPRPKRGAKLLDLGCGSGDFLEFAHSAGWQVVGVDPDPKAVAAARSRGLDAREGGVEMLDPGRERFDGITLSHVIEHVHDPLAVLQACHRLLKPRGWIWLATPNLESIGHHLYGRHWRGLEPPRHLAVFTPASLRTLLEQAYFWRVRHQSYRPLCEWMFAASEAVRDGKGDLGAANLSPAGRAAAKDAERKARRDPHIREYVTVKAWKK